MKPNQSNEQDARHVMRVILILAIGFLFGAACTLIYVSQFWFHRLAGG